MVKIYDLIDKNLGRLGVAGSLIGLAGVVMMPKSNDQTGYDSLSRIQKYEVNLLLGTGIGLEFLTFGAGIVLIHYDLKRKREEEIK